VNDWIYHYMAAFWVVCVLVGAIAGAVILAEDFGLLGGGFAGAIGGAGAALILSVSRYIGAGHEEEDVRDPHGKR
jgi:hypothetical protein